MPVLKYEDVMPGMEIIIKDHDGSCSYGVVLEVDETFIRLLRIVANVIIERVYIGSISEIFFLQQK